MQARGAGCRVEQWRLVGGGWGQRPGGRRFAPEEEVGNGCKREVIWKLMATDGGAVGQRGKEKNQKNG